MPHTYSNLIYHLVFSTKERIPFIKGSAKGALHDYVGGTIRGLGAISLETGGVEDHLHSLVRLLPRMSVSDFLMELKPSLTNWARNHVHPDFEWQKGYGAFSVSERDIPSVRRYIQNQERHHASVSFEDEFKSMLTSSGIEFDARYLWK